MSVFKPDAPPKNLAWPTMADMSAMELISYHPESLKNLDVIHRFIKNGGTPAIIAVMVNFSRVLKNEVSANTILKMMQATMERYGYNGWTVERHALYFPLAKASNLIAVDGFRNEAERFRDLQPNKKGVITGFPFVDFKKGVHVDPEGYDALDLKRCIDYASKHPEEKLKYPEQYEYILQRLGGPSPVTIMHGDPAVFERWARVLNAMNNTALPKPIMATPSQAGAGKNIQMAESNLLCGPAVRADGIADMDKELPLPSRHGGDYEACRHHDPNNVISLPRQTALPSSMKANDVLSIGSSLSPSHVADSSSFSPPVGLPLSPIHSSSNLSIFAMDAYPGPRNVEPYRKLHHIEGVSSDDVSDFAENVRWAKEQKVVHNVSNWTESLVHLEAIRGIRISQAWISSEFKAHLIAKRTASKRTFAIYRDQEV